MYVKINQYIHTLYCIILYIHYIAYIITVGISTAP